jgi:nucleosome binding factor SPN SPT16 subunit
MSKRKRRSRRAKGSRGRRGIRRYEDYHELYTRVPSGKRYRKTRKRYRKTREETREEKIAVSKKNVERNRRTRDILTSNILQTFVPSCHKERSRTRREYFSYKAARPNVKATGKGGSRFTMRRCR